MLVRSGVEYKLGIQYTTRENCLQYFISLQLHHYTRVCVTFLMRIFFKFKLKVNLKFTG